MLPALPTGMQWTSGASPSSVDDLEGSGLLALDAERVDGVDDGDRRALAELADDRQRVVEVASHLEDTRRRG